ncbi:hypothetical protein [Flavobacterium branchiicola]|uniref:Uncharacterized protein n=1 Tax=Flavobacterium branchiicola TaxID=1114875 RepID=A0ABV9PA91_9FLAO|nr:hypothetical protein [Flavobacterium branchiicola]MBS7252769.1 hypothetical protein [Flavobacterium branchiicola]
MKTDFLAQIEVKSPELKSLIFLPQNSDQRKLVLWFRKIKLLSEDLKRKAGSAPENKARENYPSHSVHSPCSKTCNRCNFVMSKDNNK